MQVFKGDKLLSVRSQAARLRGCEQGMRRCVRPQAQLLSASRRQVAGQGPVWQRSWQWCCPHSSVLPQVAPQGGASWSQGSSECITCTNQNPLGSSGKDSVSCESFSSIPEPRSRHCSGLQRTTWHSGACEDSCTHLC